MSMHGNGDASDAATPRLSPLGHVRRCCSSAYLQVAGRAGRTEYWSFVLLCAGLGLAFVILFTAATFAAMAAEPTPAAAAARALPLPMTAVLVAGLLIGLLLLPPAVAVQIRRLHDLGLSGWLGLLALCPFGAVALLVLMLMPTKPGPNRFGPPPL